MDFWSAVREHGGRVRKCLKILFNFSLSLVSFFFFQTQGVMPNLSTEKLEKILDEKLVPLSEHLKEALAMVKSLSTKYEKMEESLGALQEENEVLKEEYASLKSQLLSSANDLKSVQKSLNDLEQCTRIRLSRNSGYSSSRRIPGGRY